MNKKYKIKTLTEYGKEVGKQLILCFDKAYNEGIEKLNAFDIKDLEERLHLLFNTQTIETNQKLSIVWVYENVFNAEGDVLKFFTSNDIYKEEYDYGMFVNTLILGATINEAFDASTH